MVQVDVSAVRWQQDSDGAWLCLRVQSPQVAMNACDEYQADKEHVAQIMRKGRSLDANACGGCSWSQSFTPVPGWDAVETSVDPSKRGGAYKSYQLEKCPEFEPDEPR